MHRTGLGFDVHPLVPGRPLVLGGIAIPSPLGLKGHSDADVLCHALSDGLLAAAGLGDIGTLFPAGNPAYMGADSSALLLQVVRMVRERDWRISWASVVVQAQTPRLAPWHRAVKTNLEVLLGCGCNLTFKHGEGVDDAGRALAMYCWCTVDLEGEPNIF